MKNTVKYRDDTIDNFNVLMKAKPETQQQYLINILQQSFDSGYIKQDHKSFLKHLKEAHGCNQDQCKELFGQAMTTSIENTIGSSSEVNYAESIKKCTERMVSSINDRTNIPYIPGKGYIFYSDEFALHYHASVEMNNGTEKHPLNSLLHGFSTQDRFLFYDLETTGFWRDDSPPDITELSFIDICTGAFFQTLVNPTIPFCTRARDKTGITKKLVLNSPRPDVALKNAVDFCANSNAKVYLIAHNGTKFDRKVLKYRLAKYNYAIEAKSVLFIDSMNIFKGFKDEMPLSEKRRRLYNNEDVYKHVFKEILPYGHVAFFDYAKDNVASVQKES